MHVAHTAPASNSRHSSPTPESRTATAVPTDPKLLHALFQITFVGLQICSLGPNAAYTQAPPACAKYAFTLELFSPYFIFANFYCSGDRRRVIANILRKRSPYVFASNSGSYPLPNRSCCYSQEARRTEFRKMFAMEILQHTFYICKEFF